MKSIWHKTGQAYPKVNTNLVAQTVVVGGGIAGYMAAYFLAEQGQKVVLLEANKLFGGVTQNTTAFVTALQGLVYDEICKKHGIELARQFFLSQQHGIETLQNLVEKHNITCHFKRLPTYLFSRGGTQALKREFATLKKLGAQVSWQTSLPALNLQTTGVVKLENQAQFHPIEFLQGLPQKFTVYEHSRVTEIDFNKKIIIANKCKIMAKNIVVATHFPIFNVPEMFFSKMYQSQSYCQAYESNIALDGLYVEDIANGLTFRNYENKVIIGGFDHRVGRVQKQNPMSRLSHAANQVGLTKEPKFAWYAQDCMSFDLLPFAGAVGKENGCYVITGFNKWGMANAVVCGKLVADLIGNQTNEFEQVFSPNRVSVLNSPKKAATQTCVTAKQLLANLLLPLKNYKKLPKNSGGVFMVKGKKTGVFRSEDGNFHFVAPSCSHLGCSLTFNPHTQTFDCACHGSRFSTSGKVLSEPAVQPITKKD